MRKYILIACFILMAATNKQVEQLKLIQKTEFPVFMGDTAQCFYTADLHFLCPGGALQGRARYSPSSLWRGRRILWPG